jgi:hypothetical protein
VRDRPHRAGGDRGQVGQVGARLVPVHLLQRQHVGVQVGDGGGEPVEVDPVVGGGASVQDVEGREAHA